MPDEPSLAALRLAAEEARARGYVRARAAIQSQRATLLVLKLGAWLEERSWRRQHLSEDGARFFEPLEALAAELLGKRHKQARKRGAGFANLAPEPRHELRISLKKLRYASEFFRSLYEGEAKRLARYLKQLAALQDALGHANDVATAKSLVHRLEAEAGTELPHEARVGGGLVVGWHARGLLDGEADLVRSWDEFAAAKPFWRSREA
jgi:CHAD domain-containing protein